MTRYDFPEAGEWIRPVPTGYKLSCCDCGLVHKHDFRVVDGHVEFRVWAAPRETGQMRRNMRKAEGLGESVQTAPNAATIVERIANHMYLVKIDAETIEEALRYLAADFQSGVPIFGEDVG
jgi:hypothetical protein